MYAATQSSIDPSLAALLQTAQMVTPDKTLTVAAQVAQAAAQKMQPQGIAQGMPQAQQDFQAAIPSVMRNMQQQQMQQMVQQAMQPKPAGIEGLSSNIEMAEGGVVGFAGDGEFGSYVPEAIAVDELRVAEARRKQEEEERRKKLAELELFGAPQAVQYRQPQADMARASAPPTPPMSPEAQRMTDRQGPRGNVPAALPAKRPQVVAPAQTALTQTQPAQPTPTGIATTLPSQPTLAGAMGEVEKIMPGSGTEQNRAALEELQRMRRARPDTGIGSLAALQEEAKVMSDLKAKEDASAQERGIMAWLAGRGGRGASAQSYMGYQQNEQQRQKLFAQENTIRAAKIDAIKDANEARRIGDQEKYVEALNKLSELDRADKQVKAQLAANTLQSQVSGRGQDVQAATAAAELASKERENELNREANRKLEEYRRQTQLMKPKEQGMVERLEKLKLDEITGGKPQTATPAQKLQALRSAIQDSRGTGVEERTDLGNLRLRATMIQNELKEMLGESPRKQQLQRELDGIYRQLGGSTSGAPQGTVDKNNPLLK